MPQEDRSHIGDSSANNNVAADVISMIAREVGAVVWLTEAGTRKDGSTIYVKNAVRFDGQGRPSASDLAQLLWRLTIAELGDYGNVDAWQRRVRDALKKIPCIITKEEMIDAIKELATEHEQFLKVLIRLLGLNPAKARRSWPDRDELLSATLKRGAVATQAKSLFDACALYRNEEVHDAPARNWSELGEGLNQALGFYLYMIDAHYDALHDKLATPTERALDDNGGLLNYLKTTSAFRLSDLPKVCLKIKGKTTTESGYALDLVMQALDAGCLTTLVLGRAGAGKTTFLQDLAQTLARRAVDRSEAADSPIQIPVLYAIGPSGLPADVPKLLCQRIADQGWKSARDADPASFVQDGRFEWVLLLDGLDEAGNLQQTMSAIEDIGNLGQHVSTVVSARLGSLPRAWAANRLTVELSAWDQGDQLEFLTQSLEDNALDRVWDWLDQSGLFALAQTPLALSALADYALEMPVDEWDDILGAPGAPSRRDLEAARIVLQAIMEHEFGKLADNQRDQRWDECLYRLGVLACKCDGQQHLQHTQANNVAGAWLHELISMGLMASRGAWVSFAHDMIKIACAIDHLERLTELPDPGTEVSRLTLHWTQQFRALCLELLGSRDYAGIGISEMLAGAS